MNFKLLLKVKLQHWIVAMAAGKRGNKSLKSGLILMGVIFVPCAFSLGMLFLTLCQQLSAARLQNLYLALAGIMVFGIAAVTSMFSMAHQTYKSRDTEMLLALPVEKREIIYSRFFATVIIEMLFSGIAAVPGYVVYAILNGLSLLSAVCYFAGCAGLVFLASAVGSAISCVIYKISGYINNKIVKTAISTVLMLAFIAVYSVGMGMLQNGIAALILNGDKAANTLARYAMPVMWFAESVLGRHIMLLPLLAVAVPVLVLTAELLNISFKPYARSEVSGAPTAEAAGKSLLAVENKARSPIMAIAMKDVSLFFGNAGLVMNGGLGAIFALAAGVIFAFKGSEITAGLPGMEGMVPVLGLGAVLISCSMTMCSCALLSLEGQSLWVLKSSPISAKEVLLAKSLAHMICLYPAVFLGSVALCFAGIDSFAMAAAVFAAPFALTALLAVGGSLMNLLVPKFDWDNEVIAIKQGISSLLMMLSGFVLVALGVGIYFGLSAMDATPAAAAIGAAVFYGVLARGVLAVLASPWAAKKYSEL